MKKKFLTTMAVAMILTAVPAITAAAGQWKQDSVGSWYQNDNGSYVSNSWLEYEGNWYHFDSSGYLQHSEWINDSGKWYYMGADGICLMNTTTPDQHKVGADGAYIFQMPATGLPSLESMKFASAEVQSAYITELYYGMSSYGDDDLWNLDSYENMIPQDLNTIVTDPEYYSALCDHILKKYKNASLAESMASSNPATRVYGHYTEEYRQIYIKYLSTLSKNIRNGQYSAYVENLKNLEKESTQLDNRYAPYVNVINEWYYSAYYSSYYSDYDYYSY